MKAPRRGGNRLGIVDFGLMSFGSCLALYCGAMSVSQPGVANFAIAGVIGGTTVSLIVRYALANNPLVRMDGLLYGLAVAAGAFFSPVLNGFLPDGGFPHEVLPATGLTWMIIFGSFLTWRDGTLLFQAVPSIALFGLSGVYDTYKATPFMFFGFLLCLATVFARAQTREMLRLAVLSGYFNRPDAPNAPADFPEESPELFEAMKRGPWRWQAGPQWALASAFIVIVLSILGAPVLQFTFRDLSGTVMLRMPTSQKPAATPAIAAQIGVTESMQIGRGPNRSLSDQRVVFEVKMDRLRYLRGATFDVYTGKGWASSLAPLSGTSFDDNLNTANGAAIAEIRNAREFEFTIHPVEKTRMLPVPPEVLTLDTNAVEKRADGGAEITGLVEDVHGTSMESDTSDIRNAQRELILPLRATLDATRIDRDVAELTSQVTQGATTDAEKAQRIKEAISSRCKYNLDAKASPSGADPVHFFLFDSKEGYCDLFASSMVIMARAAGIPARYAVGFLPDGNRSATDAAASGVTDRFVVVESDYHAWAELFFEGAGWVVFDATDGAESVPGEGRGKSTDSEPFWKRAWVVVAVDVVIGALCALGVFIVWRGVRDQRVVKSPRSEVGRLYAAFARDLRSATNERRMPSQTPDEYLERSLHGLNGATDEAKRLNDLFVGALYSNEPPDAAAVAKLKADLRDFGRMLKKTRTRR